MRRSVCVARILPLFCLYVMIRSRLFLKSQHYFIRSNNVGLSASLLVTDIHIRNFWSDYGTLYLPVVGSSRAACWLVHIATVGSGRRSCPSVRIGGSGGGESECNERGRKERGGREGTGTWLGGEQTAGCIQAAMASLPSQQCGAAGSVCADHVAVGATLATATNTTERIARCQQSAVRCSSS